MKILELHFPEDDHSDAEFLQRKLKKSGSNFSLKIIQTREELVHALYLAA